MTTLLKSITGTDNLIVNTIASIGLTVVSSLIFTFIVLAFTYGIKAF